MDQVTSLGLCFPSRPPRLCQANSYAYHTLPPSPQVLQNNVLLVILQGTLFHTETLSVLDTYLNSNSVCDSVSVHYFS